MHHFFALHTQEEQLRAIKFTALKLQTPYSFGVSFSRVPIKIQKDIRYVFSFSDLFITENISECPKFDCRLKNHTTAEATLFFNVANQFLSKLGDVTLGLEHTNRLAKHRDDTGLRPNIETDAIGIGDVDIWYGNPDARIKANESQTVLLADEGDAVDVDDDDDDDDPSSDGENIVVEAKQEIKKKNLAQLASTAIVHSFTEHNNHPNLNSMLPVLLMDGTYVQIVLYDCVQDVLLLSAKVRYRVRKMLDPVGLLVVWLAINHRYI